MKVTNTVLDLLACPRTHAPLRAARSDSVAALQPIRRAGFEAPQVGVTETLLVTQPGDLAYPVSDGFPALMWPEVLLANGRDEEVDLKDARYHEAYAEMEFYNPVAYANAQNIPSTNIYKEMSRLAGASDEQKCTFPEPHGLWVSPNFDIQATIDCDEYIAPVTNKIALQLGGSGSQAIRLLMAGASEAILVTPMAGEAELAWRTAEALGIGNRLSCVLGVGEEIPLRAEAVDIISSQGCMHHMRLDLAFAEIHRVLKPGGRFTAMDPFRAPLYGIGTALLGKREQGILNRSKSIFCHPITMERLARMKELFPDHVVHNHGPVLRYVLLALNKFGLRPSPEVFFRVSKLDDRLGRLLGLGPHWGSSVMFGARRG
jgi:uncharacterized protein YbaR (Trm112 family)/SAM-dependent methyltransferase